jgi:hypothetical protein
LTPRTSGGSLRAARVARTTKHNYPASTEVEAGVLRISVVGACVLMLGLIVLVLRGLVDA